MAKSKIKSSNKIFKSYVLQHKANHGKLDLLFDLYQVYKSEYKTYTANYWNLFLQNKIKFNKFSHLGSTKDIKSNLNSAYLQICLSQSCSILNNYLSNIKEKFNEFLYNSSIADKDILHQLRTVNSTHSWKNVNVSYYPEITNLITDDFGNLIEIKTKKVLWVSKEVLRLAKKIFNHITEKKRVRFPNLNKPRLLLDSRVYSIDNSKSTNFTYWLKITTLKNRERISIPIKSNKFFYNSGGILGKTIELNFKTFDYSVVQHSHKSLVKPKYNKKNKTKGLEKVKRTIDIIFNKQSTLEEFLPTALSRTVGIDLGLCNFIATSDGNLYGTYWLEKLTEYDKKIQMLAASRQSIGLKTRSKRYDRLIRQVKGFIKTETHRILNEYFKNNTTIETVVIENLNFSNTNLSKRLNRIIQNFGLSIFKQKLKDLSLMYGFKIEEINPAYTSQECVNCGYVDIKNRKSQAKFKCLCCKTELNADIQGGKVVSKRFTQTNLGSKTLSKGKILGNLKTNFVKEMDTLISHGTVGRRNLYELLQENAYYKSDFVEIRRRIEHMKKMDKNLPNGEKLSTSIDTTTEAPGLEPMTVLNYTKYLKEYLVV